MTNTEIKELREKLGMSTQQLADKIGVSRFTINRWEAGTTKPHSVFVKMMEKLDKENGDGNKNRNRLHKSDRPDNQSRH